MKQEYATEFQEFDADNNDRLDTFLAQHMEGPKFAVFKMLLTLSHGQTSVERGYSVNKDLLVENMQEKTVVALRMVYDSVSATGEHFTEVPFTPKLKWHIKAARIRYSQYL